MELDWVRELFPVSRRLVYLNNAAVAPMATPTRRVIEAAVADVNEFGAAHWQEWIAGLARVRATLARLVGADPSEIALTKNTSEGLSMLAQGLDWRPGDRVVTFACEFPANLYPWLALRERGVQVDLLPDSALADLDALRRACRGARLLSLSFVQYLSGFRADLEAVGRICRETGTLLAVDAIQGLGAFPLDAKRCGIHWLAADGHKWLTGPEGAGFVFVDGSVVEQITPREIGWQSVAAADDYAAAALAAPGPLLWRAGALRYECGTLNTAGLLGLGAAAALLLEIGVPAIAEHILRLGERLADGLREQGCALLRLADTPESRSGITSFRHPARPAEPLVAALEAAGILCTLRQGWVRCSPHGFNSDGDIDAVLEAIR